MTGFLAYTEWKGGGFAGVTRLRDVPPICLFNEF